MHFRQLEILVNHHNIESTKHNLGISLDLANGSFGSGSGQVKFGSGKVRVTQILFGFGLSSVRVDRIWFQFGFDSG